MTASSVRRTIILGETAVLVSFGCLRGSSGGGCGGSGAHVYVWGACV